MRSISTGGAVRRLVLIFGLLAAAVPVAVRAQSVPGAAPLEALIKSSLMTFNDANVTGNYTVLHARLAKPFREQFTPEQLKAAFQTFSQQKIDIDVITTLVPVYSEAARIDSRGVLLVRGHFDTSPNRVTFSLDFYRSEDQWKLINIHVKVKPPGE